MQTRYFTTAQKTDLITCESFEGVFEMSDWSKMLFREHITYTSLQRFTLTDAYSKKYTFIPQAVELLNVQGGAKYGGFERNSNCSNM